ncbi:MipA/OmpV family protein [Salmonella enterica]|uniref:MipA/OmpV family protein n=1 Tax=Salmonella enterica TaxID=28901 RepID=UPI000BAED2C9|nr:MipA/OmpV family protein [Salmonella enterica]EBW6769470.1 MipA/OmpV family protein [Salmonella enterica subsp. enterica serovar Stanley]EBY0350183.1 MipA/OmpV family protein [Salmonella enterica subsp. enterica serovar Hvittingfoss]ASZ35812.1 MltA-interacting protein MipA [Salmonella enterica subsp. enterica serovar Saintpaul]EAA5969335.1 MipA/OmpV family protein [Salmonella enterica subsp. enterica serovar Saintpaul]EAV6111645.1 MipA/OmpV family protein [Salmonella enterica]
MYKISTLTALLLISVSSGLVQAESKFTLGAGVGVVEHPYKDYDTDIYPVPVIDYESAHFWFSGLEGGYYLWNDETDKLSITAYWSPVYFKPGDSNDRHLRRLDKRNSTMMAGMTYVHNTQSGFLRTTLAGDTLDKSNGIVWDLAWLYSYSTGRLTLTPGIGVEWNSKNQNKYYYGISRKESTRSGLRNYNPNDNWSPYLEMSANYNFLGNWNVYGLARYTRMSDEITDSPMVNKSWSGLISTGITYEF